MKVKFSDQTASDEVKKIFNSTENILVKLDKQTATNNLKRDLFAQGEKIKTFSKGIQLKSLTLAFENLFLFDNKNMLTETFVTELDLKLWFGLVSFSGEIKNNNKLCLITPDRKLKFNKKKDVYKNRITLNLGKIHTKTSFSTKRNYVLKFGLPCTKKVHRLVKKE